MFFYLSEWCTVKNADFGHFYFFMLLMICPISALFFLTFSQKLWVPCRFMSKKMEIKNDGIELNEIQNTDPLYQNRFLFEESLSIILPVNTNTGNFNISLRTPSITLSSRLIFSEERCGPKEDAWKIDLILWFEESTKLFACAAGGFVCALERWESEQRKRATKLVEEYLWMIPCWCSRQRLSFCFCLFRSRTSKSCSYRLPKLKLVNWQTKPNRAIPRIFLFFS